MQENYNDAVVSIYECEKNIWGGLDNRHVVGILTMMGIVVPDVTADGASYYRIHDTYSKLGLGRIIYAPKIYNGQEIAMPELFLTSKGIATLTRVFKVQLAMADKRIVKELAEEGCHSKAEAAVRTEILKFDREKFMSDIKNRRIKSSHAAA